MILSSEERRIIIQEFANRHDGQYVPELFLEEVEKSGKNHPAYGWFTWEQDEAAHQYRLWQARVFGRGIKISFEVQTTSRRGSIVSTPTQVPLVISPIEGRQTGNGYVIMEPDNVDHMAELCNQAASDLTGWLRRYEAAVLSVGLTTSAIEKIIKTLYSRESAKTAA